MLTISPRVVAIYVDRRSRQWVVRDDQGNLWTLPQTETPWDDRELYSSSDETTLDPIPGHYFYLLRLTT